jgi:prepilin-type N-terminal cleavage/methylation domain-containing protein
MLVRGKGMMLKSQKGFTLIEILVSLAIIGIAAIGFMSSLTGSTKTSMQTDQIDTARSLAQAQMEYVKKQSFSSTGTYALKDTIMSEYPGYSAEIDAEAAAERDNYIQKITITVTNNGRTVYTLQDCKVKR